MGPRKQLKTDPSTVASTSEPNQLIQSSSSSASASPSKKSTWTSKAWPNGQKATAVTEIARESISVAGNIASEVISSKASLPRIRSPNRQVSIQLIKKSGGSTRSLPADATTTLVNIDSNGSATDSRLSEASGRSDIGESAITNKTASSETPPSTETQRSTTEATAEDTVQSNDPPGSSRSVTVKSSDASSSSWFGWFGMGRLSTGTQATGDDIMGKDANKDKPTTSTPPTFSGNHSDSPSLENGTDSSQVDRRSENVEMTEQNAPPVSGPSKRSWMQMWGSANANQTKDLLEEGSVKEPRIEKIESTDGAMKATDNQPSAQAVGPENFQDSDQTKRASGSTKSRGWAFWSRDVSETEHNKTNGHNQQETGELVMSGQPKVQSNSEDVVGRVEHDAVSTTTVKSQKSQKKTGKTVDYKNAKSVEIVEDDTNRAATMTQASTAQQSTKTQTSEMTASTKLESVLTNQLLPSFKDTYAVQEQASWLKTLGRWIYSSKEAENRHVFALREPICPKRALAIGVHGYFPAPYLRTVLGQPTGTSLKFSTMAAKAIHQWAEHHGHHCDVEKIALEGEGRISERVDILWKLLLRWIEEIRKADFVMFACHSQGVPVTIMLVAKLIAFGCLDATRVGICAMAGVNLGPFPDYKSRFIGGSAGELFDFANPTTKVSKDYEVALKTALEFGVRISYVGSIDDQLVSLESSLFAPISHPYIYRAVFVDGRVHAPSFLSHLVGFALKLRNLGVHDHGLIRELSAPLVGSLVGGEGHSRLHDEENIYYTAVQFALETSTLDTPPSLHIHRHNLTVPSNPYILPFALRGLLEEDYVRHELHGESLELLRQFDEWKPTTKALRDVKFRLEGIRSKL